MMKEPFCGTKETLIAKTEMGDVAIKEEGKENWWISISSRKNE